MRKAASRAAGWTGIRSSVHEPLSPTLRLPPRAPRNSRRRSGARLTVRQRLEKSDPRPDLQFVITAEDLAGESDARGLATAGQEILAEFEEIGGTLGRIAPPLAPAERSELAERVAAPLKASAPQAELDVGLFEHVAPALGNES